MNSSQHYPYEWTPTGAIALDRLVGLRQQCRKDGHRVVTTNGCFDLLHVGHMRFLSDARALGDLLIVGLNSDTSVRQLKGVGHPIVSESERAAVLGALKSVDHVIVFDDLLPSDWLGILQPDVHCKAADYTVESMPEAKVIMQHGGVVKILPLSKGYSTSDLIKRVVAATELSAPAQASPMHDPRSQFIAQLLASANVLRQTAYRTSEQLVRAADDLAGSLSSGGKMLLCGNGGSAANAQHIAADLVRRLGQERDALPAIALTTDTFILTALGNENQAEQVFARQVMALGQPGDVLIAISTSGTAHNILAAVQAAHQKEMHVVGLTGGRPSPLAEMADICLAVPSEDTAEIQQAHMALLHVLCDSLEKTWVEKTDHHVG